MQTAGDSGAGRIRQKGDRLHPGPGSPGPVPGDIYRDLELPAAGNSAARPYVVINMVSSVDGRAASEGRASGIGSPTDRRVMRTLRSKVDAVMVGAGTLRAEKLNLGAGDGVWRQPLAVVVGGAGGLPLGERLVGPCGELLVALPEDAEAPAGVDGTGVAGRRVEILRVPASVPASGDGRVDPTALLRFLRAERGVGRLLVEGGPSLNRALIQAGLVDELFLTLAPKLLPGGGPQVLAPDHNGTPPRDLELLSAHRAAGELFLRYRLP